MNKIDDGGAAFPSSNSPDTGYYAEGMTLRDYFAAKALQGICATLGGGGNPRWQLIAEDSYAMADAMLRARESK